MKRAIKLIVPIPPFEHEEYLQLIDKRTNQSYDTSKLKSYDELENKLNAYVTNRTTLRQKILDLNLSV